MNRIEDLIGYKTLNQHDLEMAKRYLNVLNQAADPNSDLFVDAEFTRHGIAMCRNSDEAIGGILITGINPSYNNNFPNGGIYSLMEIMLDEKRYNASSYWRNKESQFFNKDYSLLEKTAYLDLFPFAQTKQKQFMKDIQTNISFQVRALEITLSEIERLRPRLIIAANTSTSYYWGITETTWLGYNLQKVNTDNLPPCFKGTKLRIFRIVGETGYKESNDRVGQNVYTNKSNLLGAYFIEYGLYDERMKTKHPEYLLTPELLKSLFEEELLSTNK